jgi:hypothetical protein
MDCTHFLWILWKWLVENSFDYQHILKNYCLLYNSQVSQFSIMWSWSLILHSNTNWTPKLKHAKGRDIAHITVKLLIVCSCEPLPCIYESINEKSLRSYHYLFSIVNSIRKLRMNYECTNPVSCAWGEAIGIYVSFKSQQMVNVNW